MERIPAPRRSGRGILGAGEAGGPSIGGFFLLVLLSRRSVGAAKADCPSPGGVRAAFAPCRVRVFGGAPGINWVGAGGQLAARIGDIVVVGLSSIGGACEWFC